MKHLTRYGRRLRLTLIGAMSVACLACMVSFPFADKNWLKNDVGYISVNYNGVEIGAVNSKEEAEQAITAARLRFSQDYADVVYLNADYEIKDESNVLAKRMTQEELQSAVYTDLFSHMVDMKSQVAYAVRIDDYTVTLSSKDEVVELLEKVTSKYDAGNEFQVSLSSLESSDNSYGIEVVKSEIKDTDRDIVAAALNGNVINTAEDGTVSTDGITGIAFEQNISVNEVVKNNANVVTVQQAYDDITKEKEENVVYYVQAGDTLSEIAANNDISMDKLFELNDGLSEDSLIIPGDEIVVTVPVSEISVVTTKKSTYEEDYNAEPRYVDDDSEYRGTNKVVSEGTTGHRKVTAEITYVNGVQTSIEYVNENILTESEPQVIAVGTLAKPEYVRPISGGSVSSYYGNRDGGFHKGVDWAVSLGTVVKAAADGKVTRAGWYGDYGYCVDIQHGNGTMTRYAHLSNVSVSAGQSVTQGQTIAASGNTGYSTGPHLHFEIWVNGSTVNPLDYVSKN